ncbi:hypothetical protein V3C99_018644 [Haemonchus contortus]
MSVTDRGQGARKRRIKREGRAGAQLGKEGEGILQCMREERPPGSDVLEEPQDWPKSLPPSTLV